MQIMLHFIAIHLFYTTQDALLLYNILYLCIFLKSNFKPSGFDIPLNSPHL